MTPEQMAREAEIRRNQALNKYFTAEQQEDHQTAMVSFNEAVGWATIASSFRPSEPLPKLTQQGTWA